MALPNGLYKIAFDAPQGIDYGVMYLHDGKLRGGDSTMAYVGTYQQDGDWPKADISVTQHRSMQGVVSALGHNNLRIGLEGVIGNGISAVQGYSPESSGVKFAARLAQIAD